jgi:hypothetical protein
MFAEIHSFFEKVIEEVDTQGKADAEALMKTVAADLRNGFKAQEAAIVSQILTGPPGQDVKVIAQDVLTLAESVIQQILVAHGI